MTDENEEAEGRRESAAAAVGRGLWGVWGVWGVYRQHWRAAVVPLVLGVIAAVAGSVHRMGSYRSEAVLLVHRGGLVTPGEWIPGIGGVELPALTLDGLMAAEADILRSRDVLDEAVATLGSGGEHAGNSPSQDPADGAARPDSGNLDVYLVPGSLVVRLSYQDRDPNLAQETLERIIEVYLQRRFGLVRPDHAELLQEQTEVAKGRLSSAEVELARLQADGGISDTGAHGRELEARRDEVRRALLEGTIELSALQAMSATLSEQASGASGGPGGDPAAAATRIREIAVEAAGREAKLAQIEATLELLDEERRMFVETSRRIAELEERRSVEREKVRQFDEALDLARIVESWSSRPGLQASVVQRPTFGERDRGGSGWYAVAGLALAAAIILPWVVEALSRVVSRTAMANGEGDRRTDLRA